MGGNPRSWLKMNDILGDGNIWKKKGEKRCFQKPCLFPRKDSCKGYPWCIPTATLPTVFAWRRLLPLHRQPSSSVCPSERKEHLCWAPAIMAVLTAYNSERNGPKREAGSAAMFWPRSFLRLCAAYVRLKTVEVKHLRVVAKLPFIFDHHVKDRAVHLSSLN